MKIKNKIKLTDITKIFIKYLYKSVNQLKDNKLILIFINNCYKIQRSISLINNFIIFVFYKIAHFRFTCYDKLVDLFSIC